ncbi:MAG: SDR family NAD(P)-dependent oxidoreductase [Chloroflexota bacterium]|nr:SDR family NAD(P)-dependent oxidoreductase [Chloroflexota bacterium]
MNEDLSNKAAVITGASHGLGRAVALKLAALGAHTILIARREAPLYQFAEALRAAGKGVTALTCDVSDADSVKATAAKIQAFFPSVDILINNAGIPAPREFEETGFDDWDQVIGVNLSGVFYLTRALWDSLKSAESAYVINISGTAGLRGGGSPAYGSSKFGLTGLNYAIAQAGKAHNIRSTILYPGGMDTGWRGAPVGVAPRSESMDPDVVADMIAHLVTSPPEFVVNEAVLNPLETPFM